jgi:hypothetical protein
MNNEDITILINLILDKCDKALNVETFENKITKIIVANKPRNLHALVNTIEEDLILEQKNNKRDKTFWLAKMLSEKDFMNLNIYPNYNVWDFYKKLCDQSKDNGTFLINLKKELYEIKDYKDLDNIMAVDIIIKLLPTFLKEELLDQIVRDMTIDKGRE